MSYNCKLSQYRIRFVLNWMVSSLAYTTTTVCCKIRKKVQFDEIIPHLPQMGKSKFFLLRKFRAVSPNTYLKLHFFPILMLIVQAFGHLHRWIFSISDFWAKSTVLFKWWSVTKSRSTTPWKKNQILLKISREVETRWGTTGHMHTREYKLAHTSAISIFRLTAHFHEIGNLRQD